MISISLTSGMLPRSFRSAAPSSLDASTSGTSSGGSFHAALPAEDFSKIKPSFWLTWSVALRIVCFIAERFLSHLYIPRSKISGPWESMLPDPPQLGHTPVPEQFLHLGSVSLRCTFVPVPEHSAHLPSPQHALHLVSMTALTRYLPPDLQRASSSTSSLAV